jgi:hypothetical protein
MLFSKEEGDIEWANLDACPPPDGWEVHRGQVLNFSSKYFASLGCVYFYLDIVPDSILP